MEIFVKRLTDSARIPARVHADDAGLDLFADEFVVIKPQYRVLISTGVAIAIPFDHVGLIWSRSSMAVQGISTGAGVIDCGYHGEIKVLLINNSNDIFHVNRGMRIAQLLIQPVVISTVITIDELSETARGSNGFGSSGC